MTGRAIEPFKNGATGLWNLSIVCPGAPKPNVGSTPEVAAAVKSGLEKDAATKLLSSGSATDVCDNKPPKLVV